MTIVVNEDAALTGTLASDYDEGKVW